MGFKSKTDTVVLPLPEPVRRRRIEELKGLLGRVNLDLDLFVSRRRQTPAGGPVKLPSTRRRSS